MNKIWLYRAFKSEEDYKKGESYFHEVFDDHQRMKNFSAEFSKTARQQYPDCVTTYDVYYKHGAVDLKEAGIPNVCFSLEDERMPEKADMLKQQRIERGFDDSETWSLVNTVAAFTIPRLERYIEISEEMLLRSNEQKEQIKAILILMKLTARDEGAWTFNAEEEEQITEGLQALVDNWFSLWW